MITFQQLELDTLILKAIDELGYEIPTEIQQKAIPVFLKRDTDIIALAQTGTGKTAAFGLPILQSIDLSAKLPQALVICPTRELCLQIVNDLKGYSKYMRGLKVTAVYGGSSIRTQMKELASGTHIIVSTPGRLIDLLERKAVNLSRVNTLVLDEADEMLNMGFQEDIETILAFTPKEKLTGLFSATMPTEIRKIANKYLNETVEITAGKKNTASADISHQYAVVHAKDKLIALTRIVDFHPDFFGIVFCTTKIETQEISDALVKAGYNADCLHGDLSQQQRDKVMQKFRKNRIQILCATDVAARGIDVNDITHVIHYHLPDDIENYTHRSGRTARAGKKGISIALLHIREAYKLHRIEKSAGLKFEKYLIPSGHDILENKIEQTIDKILSENTDEQTVSTLLQNKYIYRLMELSKEQLVEKILLQSLKAYVNNYADANDINVSESKSLKSSGSSSGKQSSSSRSSSRGASRFSQDTDASVRMFINLGKKDNLRYDEMRELIFKNTKVSGHAIKDIEMKGVYSFFQTDEQSAQKILNQFKNVTSHDREVRIHIAEEQKNNSFASKEKRNFSKTKGSKKVKNKW